MTKGGFIRLARCCTASSSLAQIVLQALYVLQPFSSDQFICIYIATVTIKIVFIEIQGQTALAGKTPF